MAKKNLNKKFQLIITGYDYEKASYPQKITMVTKDELEQLMSLFEEISKNTESYNWSSSDSFYTIDKFGRYVCHLDALYEIYTKFKGNDEFECLVIKTFPNRGRIDSISKIEINELKNIKTFTL